MIMTVKTPGSQMGSPAAAEERGETMGGGRGESGESSEVHERLLVTSTAPKARSRSKTHFLLFSIMFSVFVRSFSHFVLLRHRIMCWPGPLPKG